MSYLKAALKTPATNNPGNPGKSSRMFIITSGSN